VLWRSLFDVIKAFSDALGFEMLRIGFIEANLAVSTFNGNNLVSIVSIQFLALLCLLRPFLF
jgi:hypothetical protein